MAEYEQATIIESDIAPVAGLDRMVATITEQAMELAKQYRPHEITDSDDYKQSKKARASARKDIVALKGDYSASMKVIRDAVSDADKRIKAALAPLDAIDAEYKRELAAADERWAAERLASLQELYDEYAPYLVPLVPIGAIIERYGTEKGAGWMMRSTNIERAKHALCDAIDRIADGEKIVEANVGAEDLEAAKTDYFSSLDHSAAIEHAKARAAQREQVRMLEEERRATEEAVRAAQARAIAEADPAVEVVGVGSTLFVADKPAPIIDTRSTMSREQYELELESVSQTPDYRPDTRREILNHMGNRTRLLFTFNEPLKELVLDVTPTELATIQAVFRNNDVHGKMRRVG